VNDLAKVLVLHKDKITVSSLPEDFNHLNFEVVEYKDQKGGYRKAYNITRDGFMLLAMGFTGKKATELKVKFVNAFNQMEKVIKEQLTNNDNAEWRKIRDSGKAARLIETNGIQEFIRYATAQGLTER
jgi:Rha family phage regulatory protein